MNREEVKQRLPILQAFADGKAIQVPAINDPDKWLDVDGSFLFVYAADLYRIKPEEKWRPWTMDALAIVKAPTSKTFQRSG